MDTATHSGWSTRRLAQGQKKAGASQEGYTIVELSIAVAIAGVLLVSAIGLVQNVLQTNRANETVTMLTKAVAQIDKVWADNPTFVGLTLDTVAAAGAFPGLTMARDASNPPKVISVTNKFNRPITVSQPADIPDTGLNRGYVITLAGVPSGVCADLVSAAAGTGIRGITVAPEAAVGKGSAANAGPTKMDSSGKLTASVASAGEVEAGVVVLDGSLTNVNMAAALAPNACGTKNSTVALSFVGWK